MDLLKRRKLLWFSTKVAIFIITFSLLLWGCTTNKRKDVKDSVYAIETEYDAGIIPDSIHEIHHQFTLVNNSKDTCYIKDVLKSCGCTKVDFSTKIIEPMDCTEVNVIMALGSLYNFIEKEIEIHTSNSKEPIVLFVRATRKAPSVLIKKEFPYMPSKDLRLSSSNAFIGYVQHGQTKTFSINIINNADKIKKLFLKTNLKDGFDVIFPSTINPQEIARIVFSCKPTQNDWGLHEFTCDFVDEEGINIPIKVFSIITEQFEKNKTYPRAKVPITAYNSLNSNSKGIFSFKWINIGKDTLIIRNVACNNKSVKWKLSKNKIAQYDSCRIEAIINQHSTPLNDDIVIGVVSNDKIEPYKELRVLK